MSADPQTVLPDAHFETGKGDAQPSLSVHAQMGRRLLPWFDQVSITVVNGTGRFSTCAQAGELVTDLDRLQYDSGEGPGIDSLRSGVMVLAPNIQQDDRWRHYVSSAADLGLRSQLAAPLRWQGEESMGALNLYSTRRDDIAPTASLIAEALAAQVAAALASLRQIEDLRSALATRTTIAQATGLLMAQHRLSEASAFALLRRRSSHANLKLRDIAAQMVAEHNDTGRELPPAAIC